LKVVVLGLPDIPIKSIEDISRIHVLGLDWDPGMVVQNRSLWLSVVIRLAVGRTKATSSSRIHAAGSSNRSSRSIASLCSSRSTPIPCSVRQACFVRGVLLAKRFSIA